MVWQAARAVKIPVIGLGGITCGRDAMEFILAGASAVQIGTYNFVNPRVSMEVAEWIERYCSRKGVDSLADLVGALDC